MIRIHGRLAAQKGHGLRVISLSDFLIVSPLGGFRRDFGITSLTLVVLSMYYTTDSTIEPRDHSFQVAYSIKYSLVAKAPKLHRAGQNPYLLTTLPVISS